jgi:hypothetical protein
MEKARSKYELDKVNVKMEALRDQKQFEIAMRDVLGLSNPTPPVKIDEKDVPF